MSASVLVTGGGSGIGAALCRSLSARGMRVIIADKDQVSGASIAQEVGGDSYFLDVSDPSSWASLKSTLADIGTVVDSLVLNAGMAGGGDLADLDLKRYHELFAVNVDGVAFGVAAFAGDMRARGHGSIVITASMAGLTGVPFDPVYAMTKHAVVALVRSCVDEFAQHGVRLQAVCPGLVDTPLLGGAKGQIEAASYPLLSAEDVAAVLCECVLGLRTEAVTVLQPGRGASAYRFAGVPGPGGHGSGLPGILDLGRTEAPTADSSPYRYRMIRDFADRQDHQG